MNSPSPSLLYEDEWLIVINKEAGHLVHAADEPKPDDVVVMKLVRDLVGFKIFPTHRLDRPTCGVLLFAKSKTIARAINRAFERKQIQKTYHTIVAGHPQEKEWTCSDLLQKEEDQPWKEATTHFKVLQYFRQKLTLLEVTPLTGRYHQIRKHLAQNGLPIIGDYRYAGMENSAFWNQKLNLETRMLLQCKQLTLTHPTTKETITITAPDEDCFQIEP